jgi:hypothetical protein
MLQPEISKTKHLKGKMIVQSGHNFDYFAFDIDFAKALVIGDDFSQNRKTVSVKLG